MMNHSEAGLVSLNCFNAGNYRRIRCWKEMPSFNSLIEPGHIVKHPQQPDWGLGQVQSVIDDRVTVNFENVGKILINARVVMLEIVHRPRPTVGR